MTLDISVVIPLYNKNYSIVRCLNSVLYQTTLPFEIIIVNDGSTDDSLAVLDDYLKTISVRDVNVIVHDQQNQGVSAARNNGIALAKSNYIALLDADDEWYPEHIEKMTTLIEKYPRLPVYTCKHEVCENGYSFTPPQIFSSELTTMGLIDNYFVRAGKYELVNSSKVVLYKPIFESVGGFPIGAKLCEDLYLWARLAEVGCFAFTDYLGVTVHQEKDMSRKARNYSQPYILEYYFNVSGSINSELHGYLWTVYRNHLRLSILNGNLSEFISRWKFGSYYFKPKSYLILLYALIPKKIMNIFKVIRRFLLR
ncbi:glycosyltransferase family 2 protein [Vibrio cholerae]|nr:glycosyltransferase family 2 protein [Vibrio cholerae]MVB55176.1 glycosyltransferase family 2 protein [Vibrio cholerae]MVB75546.1 glycosyltransferase family 2 protein [Vibrio cholerae]MVB79156.1 glycosyltransferase family 2 protein [Vibrio cholerae]MVC38638.1 glycosyltransferase family 2 protein [Vibrio cholerae]